MPTHHATSETAARHSHADGRWLEAPRSVWERVFGAVAFGAGAVILLSDLPFLVIAAFAAVFFIGCALLCATGVYETAWTTTFGMGALGLALVLPLTGATVALGTFAEIAVATILMMYGIVKVT